MAQIKEYSAGAVALKPTETGVEAVAAARRARRDRDRLGPPSRSASASTVIATVRDRTTSCNGMTMSCVADVE